MQDCRTSYEKKNLILLIKLLIFTILKKTYFLVINFLKNLKLRKMCFPFYCLSPVYFTSSTMLTLLKFVIRLNYFFFNEKIEGIALRQLCMNARIMAVSKKPWLENNYQSILKKILSIFKNIIHTFYILLCLPWISAKDIWNINFVIS